MESTLAVNKPVPRSSGKRVLGQVCVLTVGSVLVIAASAIALRASGMMRAIEAVYFSMSGQGIAVDSATKSIGIVAEGATAPVVFRLTNRGRQPARIVGCMTNCNCTVPKGLPFTLGPGETRALELSLRAPLIQNGKAAESLDVSLSVYTTSPYEAEVQLKIQGEVRKSARPEGSGP
jgi:Protein of unknown function (DUF1573)